MAILKHISFLLLPLVLTSCFETFEPEIDTSPVLCINSLITAGEPIEVDVTHSWVYSNEMESRDHTVKDAVVSIYANGELQSPDYIPAPGDSIRIVATSRQYGSAEASVKVPVAVPIASVEFIPEIIRKEFYSTPYQPMYGRISFNMRIKLKIDDTDSADNFFEIGLVLHKPDKSSMASLNSDLSTGNFDVNAEPIFKEHIGVFESAFGDDTEGMMVFSDRQFAGKSYTLNLLFKEVFYRVMSHVYDEENYNYSIEFVLSSVSRSYYSRALYIWNDEWGSVGDMSDLGFADPVWGYSNVSTGAGIVTARSFATYTLPLATFLKSTLEDQ